ncbi:MAG: MBL fold metallo-hydrolase [Leptospiraceae bacterium]|nr:MBL fold metallo-hydrolase [Leptospiraceae bacterium]MDW7976378.1 adenylate/guanylate cyclase domain-containing protein [Leptospiraceae bacterium]
MNYLRPIQVVEDIFWIGFPDFEAGFSNNSYLLCHGNESVLFDPGPAYPMFRDILIEKIQQICPLENIRYIVVHHQDPDLCGMIPYLEKYLSPDLIIIAHGRTSLFLPYYGIRKPIASVQDGDVLVLQSKRRIRFIFTPYMHFAGSMMSYDEQTQTLFSSDIFGVLDKNWKLYADEELIQRAQFFLEYYTDSKEAAMYTYNKLKELPISKILPQHGSIIEEKLVSKFIDMLSNLNPGKLLYVKSVNSKERKIGNEILQEIRDFLKSILDTEINTDNLQEIFHITAKHSITSLLHLYDFIENLEKKYGVTILNQNQELSYETIKNRSLNTEEFIKKVYKKLNIPSKKISSSRIQKFNAFKKNLVIMNFDIRSFTYWSQTQSPEVVFKVLNKEISVVSDIIQTYRGRVNKVLGDGILAYFNEEHINFAFSCAIRIHNRIFKDGLLPAGISFDMGETIVGDVGFEEKFDYTLIGNNVNRAFRLNDIAGKGEISMSKDFFSKLDTKVQNKILQNEYLEQNVFQYGNEEPFEYIKFKVVKYKDNVKLAI